MKVAYTKDKKVYSVKENSYCGNTKLYVLKSRFSGGCSFQALKSDCFEVAWSEKLEKYVSVPN